MLCRKPFMRGTVPFGCGQCLPCRINRRRQWMWRQFLESLCHEENCFVTLTYSNEYLPKGGGLEPRDLQLWLKRIRWELSPLRIRYFAVGEYGDETWRPHYHLSVFGVSAYTVVPRPQGATTFADLAYQAWGKCDRRFFRVDEFNETTAQYVCGYVTKKLTRRDDVRLEGRHPEFARMSRNPGIGSNAMRIVAASLAASDQGQYHVDAGGDVPAELRIGKRKVPLGRFLLQRLRKAYGFTDEYIEFLKARGTYEASVEMSTVLQAALDASPLASPKTAYLQEAIQKIRNVENRAAIRKQRRSI